MNRRSFLKAAAGLTVPSAILGGLPRRGDAAEGPLATLIDIGRCDGCPDRPLPACVGACKVRNRDRVPRVVEPIPEPWPRKIIEDWSKRQDVFDRLTPYNYLFVQKVNVEWKGQRLNLHIPRRCMHCDNPACATICPFSANHKMKSGAVVIDGDLCFGGAKCRAVCPWEIPQRQSGVGIYLYVLPTLMGNGVMFKCDLCHDLLTGGKTPVCIDACPRQAMLIGARREIYTLADRAAKNGGYIYGREENGGTATLYVSPVPFPAIDAALEKKPGVPHMKPQVKRRMAESDDLGRAVLAAPLMGAAAGAVAFKWLARRKDSVEKGGTAHE